MKKEELRVGMKVKVLRHDEKDYAYPEPSKTKSVGETVVVTGTADEDGFIEVGNGWLFHPDNLSPLDPLECLEEGEILVDKDGYFIRILGKFSGTGETELLAVSEVGEDSNSVNLKRMEEFTTVFELKEAGYKPYHPEAEVEEVTVEEVCKRLGKTIKIIK